MLSELKITSLGNAEDGLEIVFGGFLNYKHTKDN